MDDLRSQLLGLELAFARRRPAGLPGGYEGSLHEAFREIGASGRWWDRASTLEMLRGAAEADVAIEGFEIEELAPGLILATYDTAGPRPARRASVWVMERGRWQIRFHQGTLR